LPRVKDSLKTFFKFVDKGIGITTENQEARNVLIWSSIDDEELTTIATVMVEGAQRSPRIAQGVRAVVKNHKRLEMGLILAPRFVLSWQHYMQNGFMLPFGGNQNG